MIGWLIFVACLLLVLFMPCGVRARYSETEISAKLMIGPFPINLIPKNKEKPKKEKKTHQTFESHAKVKPKGKLVDFLPILKLVFAFLSDFRRKLTINNLQFKLILGGSDPYLLSINYGRYWAVLGNVMPHLESWFTIKKRNLEIECDYLALDTKVDASIDLSVSVIDLLHMVLRHGFRILIKYYRISKQTKDGAVS